MDKYKVDFKNIGWESPIQGVRQKARCVRSERLRLVEYTREMEPHWCDRGHVGLILDGRFEIEFEDGTRIFESGDGVFIPAGQAHRHRARVLTDVVRVVFVEELL
jgi:hypothetical protein